MDEKTNADATVPLGKTADPNPVAPPPSTDVTRALDGSTPAEETEPASDESLAFLQPGHQPGSRGRLGQYEVLEVLGQGGFGVVLKAFDEKLHRLVAIKVLSTQLAGNATARRRFAREARAAAAVSNEHVVGIYDVDEQPVPHLVMEHVAGKTLQDKLDQSGPLEPNEVLRIGWQIASGLAAAHALGLIHRDIKPGNILLEEGVERVKITDFGLARAADDASLTQSGAIVGTPLFMSPEQALDEPIDHRADLFSLGSVLYATCTGHPPFRAPNTLAVLKRVCEETPRPIREVNPDIPDWLARIVGKLLEKRPNARFQSAAEVADLLRQHLAHLQGTAPAPPLLVGPETVAYVRPAQPARRWWLAVAGLATATAAVVGLVAFLFWITSPRTGIRASARWPRPEPIAQQAPKPYDPGPVRKLPEAAELAARPTAADTLKPPDGAGLPGQVAVLGDTRFRLPRTGMNSVMGQDREGKWLAVPNADSVVLFDARTGELVRTLTGHTDRVHAVAFSPDGRSLAAGNLAIGNQPYIIKIWDLETGKESATLQGAGGLFWALAFAPDGKQLFGCSQWGMDVWDLPTGKIVRSFPAGDGAYGFYSFGLSPDGKKLAWGDAPAKVRVWVIGSDNPPVVLDGHTERVSYTAFSPDGKLLATGSLKELLLWDATKLEPVKKIDTPGWWLAFAPDGKGLLTAGNFEQVVTRWDLATYEGKPLPALSRKPGVVVYLLSRDGKTLFSVIADDGKRGEESVRAYDAVTGKPIERHGHTGQVWAVTASPNGKLLASAGEDGTVRIWDLASGKQLHAVRRSGKAYAVAFGPDSKTLAAHWTQGPLVICDAVTGAEVRTVVQFGDFSHLVFAPDGTLLAAGASDGTVPMWDWASGQLRRTLQADKRNASAPAFSPDGKVLAAGFADGSVLLWDVASGERVGNLPRQPAAVHWVGFHPDGRSLALAGAWKGNDVPICDLVSGKETCRLGAHSSAVASGAWRADGRLLVTVGDMDGALRLWNLSQSPPSSQVVQVQPRATQWLRGVALTPEGRYAALATADGAIPVLHLPDLPPSYDPGPARPTPDPKELASRPAAADALKRENIPPNLLKRAGNGDPARVPPEVVAIFGAAHFRLPRSGPNSFMAQDREGKWLAVPNADSVALFDPRTGELVRTLTDGGRMYALAFSPDGKFLAGAAWDAQPRPIKIWDLKSGEVTATLDAGVGQMWSLAYSPDGKRLLVGGNTGVKVWDLATEKIVQVFQGGHVWQLGVSPDGKQVAYCDPVPKTVRVLNPETGVLLGTLEGFAEVVRTTAFSPDGKYLATGSDRELLLWDATKLELIKKLDTPGGWIAFEPGGKTMLTASHDQNGPNSNHVVTRWDLKTFEGKPLPSLSNRSGWAVFHQSPDGKTLYSLVVDGRDIEHSVRAYGAATGKELFAQQGHTSQVWAVAFSPDGKRVASVSSDPGVHIWDAGTGKPERVLAHEQGFYSVAFSADGKRLAAGEMDGTVVLYDATTGDKLRVLSASKSQVRAVAFSPDCSLVAGTTFLGVVRVWEVATGRLRHALAGPQANSWSVAFGPDSKTLATGWGWGEVRLFDVTSGWEVADLRVGVGDVRWLGFHPDGRSLGIVGVAAGETVRLGVWNLATRQETRQMPVSGPGHLEGAWRADGLLLASCSQQDGTVRLWSTDGKPARDQTIRLFPPKTDWLHGISMSPEGRHLATANPDGTVFLLRLAQRGEVFEVKAAAPE